MATRTIGRLMPSRTPARQPNSDFIYKEKDLKASYNIFNELTPKRLNRIIREADDMGRIGPLQRVYNKMLVNDTHYSGLIAQVERAIASLPLKIRPAKGTTPSEEDLAKDYALLMEEVLAQLDTHGLTKTFIDPFHLGVRLLQVKWKMRDYPYGRKIWAPVEIKEESGEYLRVESNRNSDRLGKLKLRTRNNPKGVFVEDLDKTGFILLEDRQAENNYSTVGIARRVLPWYLGMQFIRSWWIQYIEGYGAPMRIGKYPANASDQSKTNMEKFLRVLGQHGYALFPAEMEVQLIEANQHGSVTTFADFINKGEQEMTIHILGQGDTVADDRNGSFARTAESNKVRYETLRDVSTIVGKGYKELCDRVLSVNYGSEYIQRLRPKIAPLVIKPGDMKTKVETANKAQEAGIAVPEEFYYDEVLGSAPREGEKAVKYGQVYVFGVDPEPKSPMEQAQEQADKDRKLAEKQQQDDGETSGDGVDGKDSGDTTEERRENG